MRAVDDKGYCLSDQCMNCGARFDTKHFGRCTHGKVCPKWTLVDKPFEEDRLKAWTAGAAPWDAV